jgi:hypothetical protein
MKLEDKVNQLTELMAGLIPAVDRLAKNQEDTLVELASFRNMMDNGHKIQGKANIEMSELRLSNMKLAQAIDKLSTKIDKIDEFQVRLERLEKIVLK